MLLSFAVHIQHVCTRDKDSDAASVLLPVADKCFQGRESFVINVMLLCGLHSTQATTVVCLEATAVIWHYMNKSELKIELN